MALEIIFDWRRYQRRTAATPLNIAGADIPRLVAEKYNNRTYRAREFGDAGDRRAERHCRQTEPGGLRFSRETAAAKDDAELPLSPPPTPGYLKQFA